MRHLLLSILFALFAAGQAGGATYYVDAYVHDVNGDLRKSHEGCGIFFEAKGGQDSHFDDLLIENCHLVRTDRNGICQRRSGQAARSVRVVIRYNISQNDGISSARIFHFGGGPRNTWIYNNVIYVARAQDLPLLLFTEWSNGNAQNTYFYNNIFYVEGKVSYDWGKSRNNVFENNGGRDFFGNPVPADKPPFTGVHQPREN